MRRGLLLVACACFASLAPAVAQEFNPAELDLPALIECRAGVADYNGFAFWLAAGPGAAAELGWTEAVTDNPFLREYRLPSPLSVFGHQTATVAFTATGPMAVLEGIAPKDLAGTLGVATVVDSGAKFLGETVVLDESEVANGTTFRTLITLNVSTVDTHPGKTLAGCSYRVEVS